MKEYTKSEVAAICKACKSVRELVKVGGAFGYLAHNGIEVPFYVIELVNIRLKNLV